ncbi:MAG: RNA 2',3'-cyclic phosphodiesterase [Thermoplasmata archaeon]
MRAFVAIEVPPAGSTASYRSSSPEHLTIRFLGEILPDRAPIITDRLTEVARQYPPFDLRLEGIGAFPSARSPRVVWFGVTRGRAEVERLARAVREALSREGSVRPDEPFVPHVTWFRVRTASDRRAADDLLAGISPVPPSREFRVDRITLKESVLEGGGAVHRTLAAPPLAGDAATGSEPTRPDTSLRQR